jgi:hypothetical protein
MSQPQTTTPAPLRSAVGVAALRELLAAIVSTGRLPTPATGAAELIYLRIGRDRHRLVMFTAQRLVSSPDITDSELREATHALLDQAASLPLNDYDHHPEHF